MDIIKRPRGLVPGSVDWFRESVGPRLLQRLSDEIEAQPVGQMTPTGARLLTVGLGLIYPTVSAVHHTVETDIGKTSTDALERRLAEIAQARQVELQMAARQAIPVQFTETQRLRDSDD
jgi:hypothetical protein